MDSSETPSDDKGCNAPYEETEVADNVADTPRVCLTLGVRPCGAFSQDLDVDGGLGDNPRKSLPDIKPCVCMLPTPPLDFVMVLKSNYILAVSKNTMMEGHFIKIHVPYLSRFKGY